MKCYMQLEGQLNGATVQHDRLVTESEERIEAATNAVDNVEQEKQQLVRQLEERQRYSTQYHVATCVQQGRHFTYFIY